MRPPRLRGAVGARAVEHDVVAGDGVARLLLDAGQRVFERAVLERFDLPAAVADEVVVMAPRPDGLVSGCSRAEVDPLDGSLGGEQLEDPVDARNAYAASGRTQLVEDLLRGQAAVLLGEQLDHGAAGAAVSQPLREQAPDGLVSP